MTSKSIRQSIKHRQEPLIWDLNCRLCPSQVEVNTLLPPKWHLELEPHQPDRVHPMGDQGRLDPALRTYLDAHLNRMFTDMSGWRTVANVIDGTYRHPLGQRLDVPWLSFVVYPDYTLFERPYVPDLDLRLTYRATANLCRNIINTIRPIHV